MGFEFLRAPRTRADGASRNLAQTPSGKLLVAGFFFAFDGKTRRYLARLEADGSLDLEFALRSLIRSEPEFYAAQIDDRVVLAGRSEVVVKGVRRAWFASTGMEHWSYV